MIRDELEALNFHNSSKMSIGNPSRMPRAWRVRFARLPPIRASAAGIPQLAASNLMCFSVHRAECHPSIWTALHIILAKTGRTVNLNFMNINEIRS
jgi:hypothetical protein